MDLGQLIQVGQAIAASIALSAVFLVPAFYKARSAARSTTAEAQSDVLSMLEAQNRALRQENADLRTDLAGCESELRGMRRKLSE